jgi:hypothetical protein
MTFTSWPYELIVISADASRGLSPQTRPTPLAPIGRPRGPAGGFVRRVKSAPLATRTAKGAPRLATSQWPVMVKDDAGGEVRDARFLVSYLHREEKGSDVNVGTHLLLDVAGGSVDAAVVISNDSDLELPLRHAREKVPLGLGQPWRQAARREAEGGCCLGRRWPLVGEAVREDVPGPPAPGPSWQTGQAAHLVAGEQLAFRRRGSIKSPSLTRPLRGPGLFLVGLHAGNGLLRRWRDKRRDARAFLDPQVLTDCEALGKSQHRCGVDLEYGGHLVIVDLDDLHNPCRGRSCTVGGTRP